MKNNTRSPINIAASRLREIALAEKDGALLGNEDELVAKLGVSRATMRQAARLLEREGVLLVRRGINGGYFGARPNIALIEHTVAAYLDTLDMDGQDVTTIASLLWVEVICKAASAPSDAMREMAEKYEKKVRAIKPDSSFEAIMAIETASHTAIFDMVRARYVELIFRINYTFAQTWGKRGYDDGTQAHREFVERWRNAKLMELHAIRDGDPQLGAMAARHIRNIWQERVWPSRDSADAPAPLIR